MTKMFRLARLILAGIRLAPFTTIERVKLSPARYPLMNIQRYDRSGESLCVRVRVNPRLCLRSSERNSQYTEFQVTPKRINVGRVGFFSTASMLFSFLSLASFNPELTMILILIAQERARNVPIRFAVPVRRSGSAILLTY